MKRMKLLSISLILLSLAVLDVLPANAALSAVSPATDPANGFPLWYQDTNAMRLSQCLDQNGFCVLPLAPVSFGVPPVVVFDPAKAVAFPGNFPPESFYWSAVARMDVGNPANANTATMTMQLVGSFARVPPSTDPVPINGQQMTFLLANLRIQGGAGTLSPSSTYTVTYPFGVFTFTTDAQGAPVVTQQGQIKRLQDPAAIHPLLFADLLSAASTNIGPFLTQTGLPPGGILDAATGNRYIGNPVAFSTITPGPFGSNFTIVGPNAGGAGVNVIQQSLWNIAGKSASGIIPPVITGAVAVPPIIEAVLGSSTLMANVTDDIGVARVTADLSQLGIFSSTATLNGVQEVPPTNSTATGTGTFVIDTNANTLSFNITFSGLLAPELFAHIHGPAPPGVTAPVLFPLPPGNPKIGVWNYPQANEADILAGNTYVNIHSGLFPNGEIRAQIIPTPNASMALVSGTPLSGTWQIAVNPAISGNFTLPVNAVDGIGNAAVPQIITLTVVPRPVVIAAPANVTVGNATNVTITVTQAGVPISGATVNLSGAVIPALITNLTDINGNAIFNVNATTAGPINVTANSTAFISPGTATITAIPTFIKGCVVDAVCTASAGKPTIVDALFIAQQTVGLRTFTATQIAAGDVNADGAVNIVDALFIAQFTVGLRVL